MPQHEIHRRVDLTGTDDEDLIVSVKRTFVFALDGVPEVATATTADHVQLRFYPNASSGARLVEWPIDDLDSLIGCLQTAQQEVARLRAGDGPPRNLARFSTADAETVVGRPLTEGEYRALVKTLDHSSLGEVFAECVNAVIDTEEE